MIAGAEDEQRGIPLGITGNRLLRNQDSGCVDRLCKLSIHEHSPSNSDWGLEKRARRVTVPVLWSTTTSLNWTDR